METDASMRGWGAYYNGSITQGQWATDESNLHINVLELKAVLFGLKSFFNNEMNVHIRIKSDNMTAVIYINNLWVSNPCNAMLWSRKFGVGLLKGAFTFQQSTYQVL